MKYSPIFQTKIGCLNADEVFNYLMSTLKDTISNWEYFVNWAKVFSNVHNIEIELNILNVLIGKEDIENELISLIRQYPNIIKVIPILIACRNNKCTILISCSCGKLEYKNYSFDLQTPLSDSKIYEYIEFLKNIGFLNVLQDRKIKSIVDYVIGVEVGLGTNARKNRCGILMENIVESLVSDICNRNSFEYISQATAAKVNEKWKLSMPINKSSRKVDFAIYNGTNLYLIETNFYSVSGSKLNTVSDAYRTMFDFWKNNGSKLIWITDGYGWKKTDKSLQETFNYIDYILNLDMLSKGLLEDIIIGNL